MKIVKLIDGLANQMFEYVFGRYIEVITGENVYFDDAYCSVRDRDVSGDELSGYADGYSFTSNEITRVFGTDLNVLRNYFSEDVWANMVYDTKRNGLYKILKSHNPNLSLVAESWFLSQNTNDADYTNSKVFKAPTFRFTPEIIRAQGDVYYAGVWINRLWYYSIMDIIDKEFLFPPIQDKVNLEFKLKIDNTNSVGIHIRRGGFTSQGYTVDPKWYSAAVDHIRRFVLNPEFFVFSDDIDWCEKNINAMGLSEKDNITFVRGNFGLGNYIDMQLMSYCKNLIIANSTFSFWAALLNKNTGKIVLSPDQHYFFSCFDR